PAGRTSPRAGGTRLAMSLCMPVPPVPARATAAAAAARRTGAALTDALAPPAHPPAPRWRWPRYVLMLVVLGLAVKLVRPQLRSLQEAPQPVGALGPMRL